MFRALRPLLIPPYISYTILSSPRYSSSESMLGGPPDFVPSIFHLSSPVLCHVFSPIKNHTSSNFWLEYSCISSLSSEKHSAVIKKSMTNTTENIIPCFIFAPHPCCFFYFT